MVFKRSNLIFFELWLFLLNTKLAHGLGTPESLPLASLTLELIKYDRDRVRKLHFLLLLASVGGASDLRRTCNSLSYTYTEKAS
uniref:Putative secreted protein n=1 Tax=Anopheles darlingi TaxID=43151 RepID=A0A2M4DES6_ANODA